ncbi:MAG: 2,3,4,5-tetrahydropyridine-2,6-dicarboxylate N-succinyltransferase, partial [Acidiferrobacteraceae bacterium]|nr:2,3,4,5-tetrahydropyridine-2,6-dicarboxylate N-succinyltransferase [Acidiferrobacteraceae bacterium]
MKDMQTAIESAFEQRNDLSQVVNSELHDAVNEAIIQLDSGMLRVAEPIDDQWVVCEWLKKAVLLSFVLH